MRAKKAGLTLVEMLIAVTLLTFVSALTLIAFQTAMRSRVVAEERVDLYERARTSMDMISNDLRTAYLSKQSVSEIHKPWKTDSGLPKFVGLNRAMNYPYTTGPICDPEVETAYINRYFVTEYPRDMLSFAAVQDNPGGLSDIVHIAYTCVRNWEVDPTVTDTERMTLVRGYRYATRDPETGEIIEPNFGVPLTDTDEEDLTWSAVSENVWGIDFQFFTYDLSAPLGETAWTNSVYDINETVYVNRAWAEGMPEWHSAAESCCFATEFAEPGALQDEYDFESFGSSNSRQPLLINTQNGSMYPMFYFLPLEVFQQYYYSENFFLANELTDKDYARGYRQYLDSKANDRPSRANFNKMTLTRDGLPQLVQITLWLQAKDKPMIRDYGDGRVHPDDRALPVMVQTRVYLSHE